ncbi:hypothetical protein BST45_07860 [Mycobacterium shinjukuense]|uniref:Uncharacterized protein n=1 Tax=Mycobacterium shinjukuense TaxID=398694 RepID=A0A7I7MUU4_9MYCO|nr:hypothetical protein BST45_07860 [Mycobacterium shinjukuense]BBX75961.1 hypothetical protein MSHI_38670 [Mycobacterium shinjukuense]
MDRQAITAAFDTLDAGVDAVLGLDCEALTTHERMVLLERVERVRRRLPAAEHPLINQLARSGQRRGVGRQTGACDRRVDADQPRRGRPPHR